MSKRAGLELCLTELSRVLPSGAVLTDADLCQSYARDESEAAPVAPDAVVRARHQGDMCAVLQAANRHAVPVTPRAGGTGRVGGAVPVQGGIVLSCESMAAIKGIERDNLIAVFEPGVITGEVHAAVEAEGLFFPPDPNSWASCRLGGNVATNAGGPRALKYGSTRDYVLGLEVVTGEGLPLTLGKRTVKGVTGYDLTSLVVGSEGTLAVVSEVTLKLLPKPQAVGTLLVLLPDLASAGRAVSAALSQGVLPRCCELLDGDSLSIVRPSAGLPIPLEAQALLLIELDGDEALVESQLERVGNAADAAGALQVLVARHSGERERLWAARRELSRSMRGLAKYKLSEDVVVPRTKIAALLDHCRAISEQTGIRMPSFGHAGDGNIHVNFLWNDPSQQADLDRAVRSVFETVVSLGGTLTGEHGLGIMKAPYLALEQSAEVIELQRRVKLLFDPRGILNPGKLFPNPGRPHGSC